MKITNAKRENTRLPDVYLIRPPGVREWLALRRLDGDRVQAVGVMVYRAKTWHVYGADDRHVGTARLKSAAKEMICSLAESAR